MQKKIDYHIHTEYSSDSELKLEQLVKKAKEKQYHQFAITEHFDLISSEIFEYGVPSLKQYFHFANAIRKRTKQDFLIGLELGELHKVKAKADEIFRVWKPELVIGSIHVLPNGRNISIPMDSLLSKNEIISYYEENLALVENCEIDILGHLGIFKRYYDNDIDETFAYPILKKILETMIAKNIALEVNFSGLRKSINSVIPTLPILKMYKSLGGKLVSIGSDSHSLSHFDDYFDDAIAVVNKFEFEIFEKKKC